MQKIKGNFNYIDSRRKSQLFKSILAFGICLSIFLLGLALNNNSKNNIFTIFAVLGVLPSTKILISYILLIPYHSVSKELYEKVKPNVPENVVFYTDVVFTSEERSMMLDFVAIDRHFLIGYRQPRMKKKDVIEEKKNKEKLTQIYDYLKTQLELRKINYQVEMYDDLDRYLNRISKLSLEEEQKTEDYKEVTEYFWSLMV